MVLQTLESGFTLFGGDDLRILKARNAFIELEATWVPFEYLRLEVDGLFFMILKLGYLPQITLVFHFLIFVQCVFIQVWVFLEVASSDIAVNTLTPILSFSNLFHGS